MEWIAILIGAAVGVLWAIARKRSSRKPPSEPSPPSEPLSTRLHRLGAAIDTFATGSSHPRELTDRPEFQEAVNVLARADVPMETVRQYALGANSALSCVALASLASRTDRDQLLPAVLGEFHSLMPWPIHFGLEYLLAVDDRPPVGAPILSVRDWWSHHPGVGG